MRIIITNVFRRKYLKTLSRYLSESDFVKFVREKNHTFVRLRHPYFKIKGHVKTISIRGTLFLLDNDSVIPLTVFLKTDKRYGENIRWELFENEIISAYKDTLLDIQNGDYVEY